MKKSYIELEIELDQIKRELAITKQKLVTTKEELDKTKNLLKIALHQILILQQEVEKLKQPELPTKSWTNIFTIFVTNMWMIICMCPMTVGSN